MMGRTCLAAALALVLGAAPALAQRPTVDQPIALIQALDKVTARVALLPVVVGDRAQPFGTLDIIVHACRSTRPEESPEDAAFLEIHDTPPGQQRRRVFNGWMFASSPAISALDHAVFDVTVKDCVAKLPEVPEDFAEDPLAADAAPIPAVTPPRPPAEHHAR